MDIDEKRIRRLDLTLLMIFGELVRQGRTTAVASRFGLSQSAISHALARLRDIFGDELFVRRSDGLDPTARALELAPQVENAITIIETAVGGSRSFDPAASRRVFRIGANDLAGTLLAGPLIKELGRAGPEVRAAFRFVVGAESLEALRRNEIDLALGRLTTLPADVIAAELFEETFVVIARKGHPIAKRELTLDAFVGVDHLLVSFRGGFAGLVDLALKRKGLERRIAMSVPMFMTALATVATSDLIATVPARIATAHARRFGLRILEPPLPIEPFRMLAVRHVRSRSDRALDWLMACIENVVDESTSVMPRGGQA